MSLYVLLRRTPDNNTMVFGSTMLFTLTLIAFLLGNVRAKDTSETCKTTSEWMTLSGFGGGIVLAGYIGVIVMYVLKNIVIKKA